MRQNKLPPCEWHAVHRANVVTESSGSVVSFAFVRLAREGSNNLHFYLMTLLQGRCGMRVFVAALLCAGAARASEPPTDDAQLKLDGAIQGLKEEVIGFNREATDIENSVLYPTHTRTDIYLGVQVAALLIKSIKVTVDDLPAQSYLYSDPEARALLNSEGLHRIMRVPLEPGPHRLAAEYTAQYADAKADAPLIGGKYEAIFDKYGREADLELRIARSSRLSDPEVRLREFKPAAPGEKVAAEKPVKRRIPWRLPWR